MRQGGGGDQGGGGHLLPRPQSPWSEEDQDYSETTGAQGQREPRCQCSHCSHRGRCRGLPVMFTAPLKVEFTIIVVVGISG